MLALATLLGELASLLAGRPLSLATQLAPRRSEWWLNPPEKEASMASFRSESHLARIGSVISKQKRQSGFSRFDSSSLA